MSVSRCGLKLAPEVIHHGSLKYRVVSHLQAFGVAAFGFKHNDVIFPGVQESCRYIKSDNVGPFSQNLPTFTPLTSITPLPNP